MVVVRQVGADLPRRDAAQVDSQVVGEVCRVNHRDCHGSVLVDIGAHVDVLHVAGSANADRARAGESEI